MKQAADHIALVDLGGTQIRVAISDLEGGFVHRLARPTPPEGGDATLDALKGAVRQAATEAGAEIEAIAIIAPGPLDPRRGLVVHAPNIPGWRNIPLSRILGDEFGVPVQLGNDASLAAVGEQWYGAGQGHHDLIYLTVSTGIGGGVIIDDRLLIGANGYAAEMGHNTVVADGPLCNCGNLGCVETLASGPAIARRARLLIKQGRRSLISEMVQDDLLAIDAKLVGQAAAAGDALAKECYDRAGYYLGVAITNFLYTFNPTIVILGGGVSKSGPLLFDPVITTVRARAPRAYWEDLPIVQAALGEDIGLRGALAMYLSEKGVVRS